jgi:hypothetical protein
MYAFIPQFEAVIYTTNQTYKLLSISKNYLQGEKRISFMLLIGHYWGAWNLVHMKLASMARVD